MVLPCVCVCVCVCLCVCVYMDYLYVCMHELISMRAYMYLYTFTA